MIKIAILIDVWFPVVGGGQVHVEEIAKRICKKNECVVEIITSNLGIKKDPATSFTFHKKMDGLKIIRLGPKFSFKNPIGRILYIPFTIFYLLTHDFDIIHAQAFLPGIPGKIISLIKRKPVVFTVHGAAQKVWKEMGGKITFVFFKLAEKIIFFKIHYDWQITVSPDFLRFKNINRNISFIPNGVDIKKFDRVVVDKDKEFKIIFVGRLHPQKGLIYLFRAVKIVQEKLRNVYIVLVGQGVLESRLKKEAEKLKMIDRLIFTGRLEGEKLIKEYKSSHLFVLPSLYEGQPITLLEAWAAKLPVVVTNVGGNEYFVKNGINGYIVPPKNQKELAKKILDVLSNPKREIMGERGYQLVKKKYSWEKVAEETYKIYLKVLKK